MPLVTRLAGVQNQGMRNPRLDAPMPRPLPRPLPTLCALALGLLASAALAQPQPAPANALGMQFVRVPTGSFWMGSADDDRAAHDVEKPRHRVTLSRAFDIATHEVTQAQWQAVMGEGAYTLKPRSNPFYELPGMAARITRPDHPAAVSWEDAQRFIARLNAREPGARYRLPTEAEWEYAARAGTDTAYSFGDSDAGLSAHAWHGEDFASGGTHPVGQKKPNPWGLYDVHGNVWEWVQDWYAPRHASNQPATDPQGPASGSQRVVKGGSWHSTATSWRTAYRKGYAPDYRGISIGFRLVREINH